MTVEQHSKELNSAGLFKSESSISEAYLGPCLTSMIAFCENS